MRRSDPRIRQTLNHISKTIESANLNTQASLFAFSETYVSPCLSSLNQCLEASCYPCIGARRDVERRLRHRNRMGRPTQRGRPELSFDFYDDWDDDEGEGTGLLGGWGNDELDRLLAGSGAGEGLGDQQPRRHRAMSYGSRGVGKSSLGSKDGEIDSTIVPQSSMFGFLERLPWKIGGRGLRYKPSAKDLQDHPGRRRREEEGALIDESEGEGTFKKHSRKRSGTDASRSTTNSLSSRGDLFPSDDEDDAVPLDDEFAMVLERRTTGPMSDDVSSRKSKTKRHSDSRASIKTESSKDTKSPGKNGRGASISSTKVPESTETANVDLPSLEDLKVEEQRVREEEEAEVEKKRQSAQKLAAERGLSSGDDTRGQSIRNTHAQTEISESGQPQDTDLPPSKGQQQTKDEKPTDSRPPADREPDTPPISSKL